MKEQMKTFKIDHNNKIFLNKGFNVMFIESSELPFKNISKSLSSLI